MKKAILFDLDGTLWDSSEEVAHSWSEVLAACPDTEKQITKADMHRFMGKTLDEIGALAFPEIPEQRRKEIMQACVKHEVEYISEHGAKLLGDIRGILTPLKEKYTLCIISNCQDGYIQCFLDYFGFWDIFDDIECPGRTGKGKGENIRIVMQRQGIDKAVYLGDTQGDLNAADEAGVPFVFAEYGFGSIDRHTESISSLAEIAAAAERILCRGNAD